MSSKSKSKQAKKLVCGNCGIDLPKEHFAVTSRNEPTLYRCLVCAKVQIKRDETDLLTAFQKKLRQLNDDYTLPLLIDKTMKTSDVKVVSGDGCPLPDESVLRPPNIKFVRYSIVYLTKLIDMLKNDLQTLNYHKYKMSRQYLMAISSKLIDEAELLSEQGVSSEESYRLMCEHLQDYLKQFDGIFQSKLIFIRKNN